MTMKRKLCEHDMQRYQCRKCGGGLFCSHGVRKAYCGLCGGSGLCVHGKRPVNCKRCGAYGKLRRGGFTKKQIIEIGATQVCQYPHCLVGHDDRSLNSDHFHDGNRINRENYRGELCDAHNMYLGVLDRHPEWANADALEYMSRRPYAQVVDSKTTSCSTKVPD